METTVDAKGCIFVWNIENLNRWNWLKMKQKITSPVFCANALRKTKWALELSVKNEFVGINLHRKDRRQPYDIEIAYEIAFLCEVGSILKKERSVSHFKSGEVWGFNRFVDHKDIFYTNRNIFFPEDTLSVQCILWHVGEKPDRLDQVFETSVIEVKRKYFLWRIDKPLDLKSDLQNEFDYFSKFSLHLKQNLTTMQLNLIRFDKIVKYVSLGISIIVPEERRKHCMIHEHFFDNLWQNIPFPQFPLPDEMRNPQYFPDDVLSFHLELVLLSFKPLGRSKYSAVLENNVAGNEKSPREVFMPYSLKNLYNEDCFKNIVIRTPTKTFTAHRRIVSARSEKFRNMFLRNREGRINDFDDDTVEEMLKYIYSGSLKDLSYEMAFKLLAISNCYDILSLKSFCFSFLQDKLCQANACELLVLADKYNDTDLKTVVEDYILRHHKPIFRSQEWKDLMKQHKIAANAMYRMIYKTNL